MRISVLNLNNKYLFPKQNVWNLKMYVFDKSKVAFIENKIMHSETDQCTYMNTAEIEIVVGFENHHS